MSHTILKNNKPGNTTKALFTDNRVRVYRVPIKNLFLLTITIRRGRRSLLG